VTLIKLNNSSELDSVVYSDTANFDGKTVELQQSSVYQIDSSKSIAVIDKQLLQKYMTEVSFDQGLIQSLKKNQKNYQLGNYLSRLVFYLTTICLLAHMRLSCIQD
jgi:hypothetical protein